VSWQGDATGLDRDDSVFDADITTGTTASVGCRSEQLFGGPGLPISLAHVSGV
jgi:hypothetical protein